MKTLFFALMCIASLVMADDPEKDVTVSESDKSKWTTTIQQKYSLTDDQMKKLTDSGLSPSQMTKVAHLALKSGKPIDDILRMRTEQKMGWGKIAHELGVRPGEIGKGVADLRHELNEKRQEHKAERMEKKAERIEKRAARLEKKAERIEKRAEKMKNH